MKKFLLSLGIMAAIFGAVSLQSCSKDDTEGPTVQEQEKVAIENAVSKLNDAGTTAKVSGESVVVTTTNASGQTTTSTYTYSYTVDGQTYTSAAALQAALAGKTNATVVTTLLMNGKSTGVTTTSTVTVDSEGAVSGLNLPEITTAVVKKHSGGAAQ